MRRLIKMVAMLAVLAILAGGITGYWGWRQFLAFTDRSVTSNEEVVVCVEPGDSFNAILSHLRVAGIDSGQDWEWKLLVRRMAVGNQLKVGEYAIPSGSTPRQILQRMRDGRTIQYRFTIIEGWNIRQLRAALNDAQPLEHMTKELSDEELMAQLNHSGQHPEGRFLPETYLYRRGDSDVDILRRAYSAMEQALDDVWAARAADVPLRSKEEVLILASIVEKETGQPSERPEIAGVFARRLERGMLLQTDPTVIYGMGSAYAGNIRTRDLRTDTPYNTYTRAGLPPTPIAMPGKAALQAVTHPAPGTTLYFVSRNDGSHVFSTTYAEHSAWVDCYQRGLLARCPAGRRRE